MGIRKKELFNSYLAYRQLVISRKREVEELRNQLAKTNLCLIKEARTANLLKNKLISIAKLSKLKED